MASGSQNMTTYNARTVTGSNSAASPAGALLLSGADRADNATGDTWIFFDSLGGTSAPSGIKHDQTNNKIQIIGAGTNSVWTRMNTGDTYILGKVGIGYDPETSENLYKLYVNGSSFFNDHVYLVANKEFYMQYDNTMYDILYNHNNGNISVNAASAGLYMGYYNTTFVNWMNGRMELRDGCLSLFPNNNAYRDGMRIHMFNSWSTITLCGADNTGNSGTSENSWFIGNNNGNFYIARNGSPGSTAYIGCVSNVWKFVTAADIPEGAANLSAAASAHTLSIYRNGITIPYQMDNVNDGGMLRVRGTAESNCILELGTWDDSGAGETIQFNYYPTTSQVTPTYSIAVPKETGTIFLRVPWWTSGNGNNADTLRHGCTFAYTNHNCPTSGTLVAFDCSTSENYTLQLQGQYSGEALYYRNRNGDKGTWNAWQRLVHNAGTWSISITGNAATATALTSNAGNSNTPVYFSGGKPVATNNKLGAINANGYWGMRGADNGDSWIRTTSAGIIPVQSGGRGGGHCGLGTSSWYFSYAYVDTYYANRYSTGHGYINGAATNGGINMILAGDDVWLGDCNIGGTLGLKSNNTSDAGLSFYGSDGSSKGRLYYNGTGHSTVGLYNAVWNDYAEFRKSDTTEPGYVICPSYSGIAYKSNVRLQAGARVISDTFGFIVGECDEAKTPVGLAGRVLAYPYRNKSEYKIGDAVCSAPGGTVDIMTREEIMTYPDRIVGIVNEIPDYEVWESTLTHEDVGEKTTQKIEVKGRIWIDIK